jgi:hypothetical protein
MKRSILGRKMNSISRRSARPSFELNVFSGLLNQESRIGNDRHDSVSAAGAAHSLGQLPGIETREFALPSLATPVAPLLHRDVGRTSRKDCPMKQPPVRSVDLRVEIRSRRRRHGRTRRSLKISPYRCLGTHRSGRSRHRINTSNKGVRCLIRRRGWSNVFITTTSVEASTTGVISLFCRIEGSHERVPHDLADGLNMREPAIDPVIIEVPQAGHVVGLAPNSTGVETVAEEDSRLGVGRKLAVASSTDRTGEKVNERATRDAQTFELPTSMSGGPWRNTVVFRNVVGHAKVASSERPPLLWEAGLLESHTGAFDDAPSRAFGDTA